MRSFLSVVSFAGWITFEDPWSFCPPIHLRGSCHELGITFGGAFCYLQGYRTNDHLRQPSSGESSCDDVALLSCWNRGLVFALNVPWRLRPQATFADEKSLTNPLEYKKGIGRPEKGLVENYSENTIYSGRRLLLCRRAEPLKKFSLFIFPINIPTKNLPLITP